MKATLTFLTLFLFLNYTSAQNLKLSSYEIQPVLKIQDSLSNQEYSIQIYLPKDYSANKKYPVIYFFDANNSLLSNYYITNFDALSYYNNIPKSILVGVNQINREKELGILRENNKEAKQFLEFVRIKLKKTINNNYSTIGYNSYIGHSLGGQFLTYGYINFPDDFYSIINFSPALLYPKGEEQFLNKVAKPLEGRLNNVKQPSYYYCETGESGFQDGQFSIGVRKLEEIFKKGTYDNLNFKFDYLGDYTHSISPFGGLTNGLLFLFKDWNFSENLAMSILVENKVDAIKALGDKHKQIIEKYNKKIALPEFIYTSLYDNYFSKEQFENAIKIIEMEISFNRDHKLYSKIAECYKKLNKLKEYNQYLRKAEN